MNRDLIFHCFFEESLVLLRQCQSQITVRAACIFPGFHQCHTEGLAVPTNQLPDICL